MTRTRPGVAPFVFALLLGVACSSPDSADSSGAKTAQAPEREGHATRDLLGYGEDLDGAVELYPVPPSAVHPEVVAMAGGPDAIALRAATHLKHGRPVEALHLVDMALAASPDNRAALEVRLGALEVLLEQSGEVTHYETMWLKHRVTETADALGIDPTDRPEREARG